MRTEVETLHPDDTALVACQRMLATGFGELPVVDAEGNVLGFVADSDVIRLAFPKSLQMLFDVAFLPGDVDLVDGEGRNQLSTTRVTKIMRDVAGFAVTEETSLAEAALLMLHHDVRRLPVLREGKLVGTISSADIVKAILDAMERPAEP
jgi:predicted transcriptional regulator